MNPSQPDISSLLFGKEQALEPQLLWDSSLIDVKNSPQPVILPVVNFSPYLDNSSVFVPSVGLEMGAANSNLLFSPPAVDQKWLWEFAAVAASVPALVGIGITNKQLATTQTLEGLKAAAIDRWAAVGLSMDDVAKLQNTSLAVEDLAVGLLGKTRGYQIVIDRDAAGVGWFVDPTPQDDSEFPQWVSASESIAIVGTAPFGRVDLLTVLEHEFGHVLGLAHDATDALMQSTIPISARLLPNENTIITARQDKVINDNAEIVTTNYVVSNVTVPPEVTNHTFALIDLTVTNNGTSPIESNIQTSINFYLSKDEILGDEDRYVHGRYLDPIPQQTSVNFSENAYFNSSEVGQYFLLATIDEFNNTTNAIQTQVVQKVPIIVNPEDINLKIINLTAPEIVNFGASFNVSWNVNNQGVSQVENRVQTTVYLSNDNTLDDGDNLIFQEVKYGETQGMSNSPYSLDIQYGTYNDAQANHVIVVVDAIDAYGNIITSDSLNDISVATISFRAADLVVTSLGISDSVSPGGELTVSWTVKNQGDGEALPTYPWAVNDGFYLSKDEILNYSNNYDPSNDKIITKVSTTDRLPLSAGNEYAIQQTIRIPTNTLPGNYFFFLKTDNGGYYDDYVVSDFIPESVESNNTAFVPFTVSASGWDLAIENPQAPTVVDANSSFDISWQVRNIGSSSLPILATNEYGSYPLSIYDAVYLSVDSQLDSSDILVGSTSKTVGDIPIDSPDYLASTRVYLNSPGASRIAGDYFLIFMTDAYLSLGEDNRTNNSTALPLKIKGSDLQIVAASAPDTVTANQPVQISWTVKNNGELDASGYKYDSIFISDDLMLDENDIKIGQAGGSANIPIGQESQVSVLVNIPNSHIGDKYLIFQTNSENRDYYSYYQYSQVSEINFSNNTFAKPISIVAPDLAVIDANASANALPGAKISVSWQISNPTNAPALAVKWNEKIYLSQDNIWDIYDRDLSGNFNGFNGSSLDAYSIVDRTQNILVPRDVPSGDYFLFVVADPGNQQVEINEDNNVSNAIPIAIQQADLRADQLTTVDDLGNAIINVEYGQPFNVAWYVSQIGDGTVAASNWRDNLYLSKDSVFSADDVSIWSQAQNKTLSTNTTYTNNESIIINYNNPLPVDANGFVSESEPNDSFGQSLSLQKNFLPTTGPENYNNYLAKVKGSVASFNSNERDVYHLNMHPGDKLKIDMDGVYAYNLAILDNSGYLVGQNFARTLEYQVPINASSSDYYIQVTGYYAGDYNLLVNLQTSVALPVSIEPANYFLILKTDAGNSFVESNEANNTIVSSTLISLSASTQSDLSIVGSVLSPSINVQADTSISWTVSNSANADPVKFGWYDYVYLSDDEILNNNDIILTSATHSFDRLLLNAGESYTTTASVILPAGVIGQKYLIFATDRANSRTEIDETNNQWLIPIDILAPDLTIATPPVPDKYEVSPNEQVSLAWQVANIGNGATNHVWRDRVYFSTDPILSPDDISIGAFIDSEALAAGAQRKRTVSVNIPDFIDSRNGYFLVAANPDRELTESNNNNNVEVSVLPIAINQKPDPDLQVTHVEHALGQVWQPGEQQIVSWAVKNNGLGDAKGNWIDRVYLSTDGSLTGAIFLAAVNHTGGLVTGANYMANAIITLPAVTSGDYRIVVVTDADDQVFEKEQNDNNQTLDARSLALGRPDLEIASISKVPSNIQSDEELLIDWTVHNNGNTPANGGWRELVYLSDDPNSIVNGVFLGSFANSQSLAANASFTRNLKSKLPLSTNGQKYVIVKIDSSQRVYNDQDASNESVSVPLQVNIVPYANLVTTSVTAPTLLIRDPAELTVSWTVANQGTGRGITDSWIDRVVLVGEGTEVQIGEFTHTDGLNLGASYVRTETIVLPQAFIGTYRVEVRTDAGNSVFENSSEADNTLAASQNLTVFPYPSADLAVTNLQLNNTANSGQNINVSWTVENQGIGVAVDGSGTLQNIVKLIDANGQEVATPWSVPRHLGAVIAGGNYEQSLDLILPNGISGTYYISVGVFGGAELVNTNNNTQIIPININLSPAPDLVVTNVTAPTDVRSGDRIEVGWEVKNQGDNLANGVWNDSVYLEEIGTTKPLIQIGSFSYNRSLEQGKSYSRLETMVIGENLTGQYRVVVKANEGRDLYEAQTANNSLRSDRLQIVLPTRPDLVIERVIVPESVDAGSTLSAKIEIKNNGTANANGGWQDIVYFSLDDKIDTDDILMGSFDNTTALTPGASYFIETNPTVVPKYYRGSGIIIIKTDSGNVIKEFPHEDNNTAFKSVVINSFKPADLVTGSVIVPEQAFAGSQVDVRYRVTNLGVAETSKSNWTDTIWVAPTRQLPSSLVNAGSGIKLTELNHQGSLKVGESYEVLARVTLPQDVAPGQYFITPWSDTYDVVVEDIFDINRNPDDPDRADNNNYKAAQLNILQPPLLQPDLVVDAISTSQLVSGTTDVLNIHWTVTNTGVVSTKTRIEDTVYLSTIPTVEDDNQSWKLGSFIHQATLGVGESYSQDFSRQLAPGISGKYYVIVKSKLLSDEEQTTTNNISAKPIDISTILPADLVVSSVVTQPTSFSNEAINIQWTVTNQGNTVWNGTKYWVDDVWLSPYPTLTRDQRVDKFVGRFTHDNSAGLASGSSYTNNASFELPAGISEKYYVYVVTNPYSSSIGSPDSFGDRVFEIQSSTTNTQFFNFSSTSNPSNNLGATNLQVVYREPDLQITQTSAVGNFTPGRDTCNFAHIGLKALL